MAVVRFYRTSPVPGNTTPAVGWLEFTPTGRRVIAGDPDNTVLPMKFSVQLEAGRADVDLAATSASWAWQIREHIVGLPPRVWTAAVPSGSVTVDDTDLVVVSPGTLVPVEVNDPAFTVEATTLAAGASATAAITGSYPALKLNLGIPQGPAGAGSPPATAGAFGSVKLAGDLGGLADAPTVPGLPGMLDAPNAAQTFLFADGVHPTTAAHAIIAQAAESMIEGPMKIGVLAEAPLAVERSTFRAIDSRMFSALQAPVKVRS